MGQSAQLLALEVHPLIWCGLGDATPYEIVYDRVWRLCALVCAKRPTIRVKPPSLVHAAGACVAGWKLNLARPALCLAREVPCILCRRLGGGRPSRKSRTKPRPPGKKRRHS